MNVFVGNWLDCSIRLLRLLGVSVGLAGEGMGVLLIVEQPGVTAQQRGICHYAFGGRSIRCSVQWFVA